MIPATTLDGEPSELELQAVQSLQAPLDGELLLPYDGATRKPCASNRQCAVTSVSVS